MVLVIVRHGESEWNKLNKFTGLTNVNLTENGKLEAINASKQLNEINFDIAFTSILNRACDTCQIIKENLKQSFEILKNESLNERDYGDLTGKNKKKLQEEFGKEQIELWRRSTNTRPPNGENLIDVIDRLKKNAYIDIKNKLDENKNVLVVAHGNSIRALLCILNIFNLQNINLFEIPTGKPVFITSVLNKEYYFVNDYYIKPRMILDSRGNPTLEIDMLNKDNKLLGRGTAPSGASTGSNEAVELRDGYYYFMGKSVLKSIDKSKELTSKMYFDTKTLMDLKKCDNMMIITDNTELKKTYGGNTTTALSFMFADVGSNLSELPLYKYFGQTYGNNNFSLPVPMVNILNGGKHAGGNLKIQEFMIMPTDKVSFMERTEIVFIVYNNLKKLLKKTYGHSSINLGDEGGFAPNLNSPEEALNIIEKAVSESNIQLGKDIYLALDCAASEFYNNETKLYEIEKDKYVNSDELIEYYVKLIEKYPSLKSIEDPFDEKDYNAWIKFTEKVGDKIMVVGDDLYTTNPNMVKEGIKNKWANSLLLKVNQIGTISESVVAAKMIQEINGEVIVSHRSGETNNSTIADLAVGINAKYIKLGAPARGERVSKFNRLIQIEEDFL